MQVRNIFDVSLYGKVTRFLGTSLLTILLSGGPALATDYLQCREMKRALANLEVNQLQTAEWEFKKRIKSLGLDDACGALNTDYGYTSAEWNACRNSWIRSKYTFQGYDWKGRMYYNPEASSIFKKIKKIKTDYRNEGCP